MSYRIVALLAFVALIIGFVTLTGGQREDAAPVAQGPLPDSGYSALQAHMVQTGPDGLPQYTLDAARVQQQPDQGTINLEQVQLGFRDSNGNVWTARAARGQLAQNSGLVQLDGDVHVNGVLPGLNQPADMTTEHLSFDTNAQVAATHDPVMIVMSGRKLAAQGMVASLKDGHVQLESEVHGSFLPQLPR
ncbi:MAG TPA: LPS export ABC transporter periplasmic protein LptC [Steroidobacteraceae bacterium]|jgi:LPS export ABC transporter protein LptC|nr:LPS export ABC transporter periplasmic protein LptC [Steroidobacteraceae bacterium]